MQEIVISGGYVTVVDDDDYARLSMFRWCSLTNKWGTYAKRDLRKHELVGGRRASIVMHRQIISAPPGMLVDHINGNTLDNRKINLRLATPSQNNFNSRSRNDNTSGYRGVYFHKASGLWHACIFTHNKKISLGYFKAAHDAGQAYELAATELFGEFKRAERIKQGFAAAMHEAAG